MSSASSSDNNRSTGFRISSEVDLSERDDRNRCNMQKSSYSNFLLYENRSIMNAKIISYMVRLNFQTNLHLSDLMRLRFRDRRIFHSFGTK
jgi:hypothetical protein